MVNLVVKSFSYIKQISLNGKRIIIFNDENPLYYFWTMDAPLTQKEKQQLEPYIVPLLALYGVHYKKCKREIGI